MVLRVRQHIHSIRSAIRHPGSQLSKYPEGSSHYCRCKYETQQYRDGITHGPGCDKQQRQRRSQGLTVEGCNIWKFHDEEESGDKKIQKELTVRSKEN